jgi:hypothetical protein
MSESQKILLCRVRAEKNSRLIKSRVDFSFLTFSKGFLSESLDSIRNFGRNKFTSHPLNSDITLDGFIFLPRLASFFSSSPSPLGVFGKTSMLSRFPYA